MSDFESSIVTSIDGLRTLYAQPIERIAKKQLDHVNEAGRAFIAASPFLVLATASQQGLDCSPKGDQPGFVEVAEDGRMLFIPDRRGNNRIDGLKNLVEDPRIGLIFFVPGVNETYRVNGRARICQDAELNRRFCGQWQRACNGYGCDRRRNIPALCEGTGPVRPLEGG